tara:strand:+ start:1398 stop:1928 length:531 start_codon:yes stop_codon:yes gene_type:complete
MPSKGKSEWNKNYYAKNADEILYRKRSLWKEAKTIKCKCGDRAQYKDTTSARNQHFKTLTHKIWEKKQEIINLMMTHKSIKRSQLHAENFIVARLEKKRARTLQDQFDELCNLLMECIDGIDNYNKPKQAEPVNVVVEEKAPINLYGSTEKPYIPPSAEFDPLALMGKSVSDIEGL